MNPITALIESIQEGDAVSVSMLFDKLMAQKLSEAIEDKKVEIAESLFVPDEDRELQEDYEQLDELSKTTLGNYVRKAAGDSSARAYIAGGGTGQSDQNKKKEYKKAVSRLNSIPKAIKRLTKEQVEEFLQSEDFQALDELSKETLGKYVKKAALDRVKRTKREHELATKNDQLSDAMHNIDDKEARDAIHVARSKVWKQREANDDKHEKRRDGINKAIKRLTK